MSSEQLSENSFQSSDLSLQEVNEEPQEKSGAVETTSSFPSSPASFDATGQDDPKQEAPDQVRGDISSATVVPSKTQGVRPSRSGRAQALQDAAKKAAQSNSRNDVHEYMRIRRNFV